MTNDPWLTEDGSLHPAAEKMGLPEWAEEGLTSRLGLREAVGTWFVEYRDPTTKEWYKDHGATAHEAHALLEKDYREKLAERGVVVHRVLGSTNPTSFAAFGVRTPKKWYATFTAALQAAILAEGT